MENKINLVELLKDCPKGMELDCTIFDDVYFDYIDDVSDIINCYIQDSTKKIGISFSKYGCYSSISKSKCVIFPKGKTTWEGFQRPFKDGDVVAFNTEKGAQLFIFKKYIHDNWYAKCYMMLDCNGEINFKSGNYYVRRLATEEEKEKLFKAIKDSGYKWNAETKTLEKLKKEKFDITTLIPFESKVLVRDYDHTYWRVSFFGFFDKDECIYDTVRGAYTQCIPYDGNQHLLNKTDDCDEYYKTWE